MTIQGTPGTQHNDWGSMRDHQVQQGQEQEQDGTQGDEQDNEQDAAQAQQTKDASDDTDGLKGKKPEDLTPEELRLMADTMPGDGPGD